MRKMKGREASVLATAGNKWPGAGGEEQGVGSRARVAADHPCGWTASRLSHGRRASEVAWLIRSSLTREHGDAVVAVEPLPHKHFHVVCKRREGGNAAEGGGHRKVLMCCGRCFGPTGILTPSLSPAS